MVEVGALKLVPLPSVSATEDVLQIHYRDAEIKLNVGVDIDVVDTQDRWI